MIVALYLLVIVALGIYSYSQIDLNLTLFQSPIFLSFQKSMVWLGYFNRPLSTNIFLVLMALLSLFYFLLLRKPSNTKLLIGGLVLLGVLSYPAFSHDIFNYIFDARIFVTHHQNPYTSTALMFPTDDWTRFMNWTHRTYPYGPTFLPISILFYIVGLGKFVLTLLSFKLMSVLAYLGSAYLISKLTDKKGLIFFAANPLIILEVVISAHLDIVMLFFAILAWYLFVQNKKVLSLVSLAISVGIKYSTILFFPVFVWPKLSLKTRLKLLVILSFAGAVFQVWSRELLPHYLIVPIGFVALMPENRKLLYGTAIVSVFLLVIRYYPFLSTGQWVSLGF